MLLRLRLGLRLAVLALSACSTGSSPDAGRDGAVGFDVMVEPECAVDVECGDRIACSIDHCEAGRCTHEPCLDCCADGLVCLAELGCASAPETCTEDADCLDEVRCTLDRCRDGAVCEHLPEDGLCAAGETCLPALGCIPSPPDTCVTPEDCSRGNPCYGEWSCQTEFGCQFVAPPDCNDDDDCTDDTCPITDAMCVQSIRDQDDDTYGDLTCGGDDCNDEADVINPGADETCNAVDDDCDTRIDESCCTAGGPCTTSCGSMGTTTCMPDGTAGPCMPPAETCNGVDDDCDSDPDEGFACRAGAMETCTTSCSSEGMRVCDATCDWTTCTPPAERCGGGDDDCDGMADEGFACRAGTSSACTTGCGSMGTRACLADCSLDTCVPPMEVCNGVDDDCDVAADDGFACVRGTTMACTTSCGSTGMRTCRASCTYGACTPPAEGCNGMDDDCDSRVDETSECAPGSMMACTTSCGSSGSRSCGATCTYGSCAPPAETCNGADDNCNGACDDGFGCCRGSTRACSTLGFPSGTAVCRSDCSGFDTSTCSLCGNGVINGTEQCDGTNLDGETCATLGMGSGTLRCSSACTFDTSMCSAWSPSGIYDLSPRPIYMCAGGLVSYNYATFTFTDTGSLLTVNGARCPMIGPSASVTRMISVSCTESGTCDEVYTLTGMFTDDDHWTGTFTAEFIELFPGACVDCVDRMHMVTGTRR